MNEKRIDRRRMIKVSSLAAISNLILPTWVSANRSFANRQVNNIAMPVSDSDICYMSALDMSALIHKRKVSVREVMQAHIRQIEKINPKVNAYVTLVPERQP